MTPRKYDVTITIEDVDRTRDLHFYNITIQMFYTLRKKYFDLYGSRVCGIEVYFHQSKKRCETFCWHSDSLIDEQADLWERDGI